MSGGRPPEATLYALLRDGETWPDVELAGLEVLPDGRIELERVPGVVPPSLGSPAPAAPSGLALGAPCALYVAEGVAGRIVRVLLDCGERRVLTDLAALGSPAGICVGPHGWVFAADPNGARLVVLTTTLEVRDVWTVGLVRPVALASDGATFVAVLDAGAGGIIVFDRFGTRTRTIAPAGKPRALAADADGTLHVGTDDGVERFTADGTTAGPRLAGGVAVQALAVGAGVLHVANEATGWVQRFSLPDGRELGAVAGYRGPASALAADATGRVFVKPDAGADLYTAEPRATRVERGALASPALDAGAGNAWERVALEVDVPDGTSAELALDAANDPDQPPTWLPAAATDVLLPGSRFLRLRVVLERHVEGTASPTLHQAHAHTPGDSYLEYLPTVYSRDGETAAFLSRFLALAQSELDDVEAEIELLHRLADPAHTPVEALAWLGRWQAFELPRRLRPHERAAEARELLVELPRLAARRGTPDGVARLVEIAVGARPRVFESFRERRIWLLDETSALGFDTALLPTALEGLVVSESVVGESGPEDPDAWGEALFADSAHLFTAVVPFSPEGDEAELRTALDAEKPAHTEYHLCAARASLRVGVQAHVGVDAIVARPEPGLALGERSTLGRDARLAADPEDDAGAVGRRARLGLDTVMG